MSLKLITENDFFDYEVIVEQKNPSEPKFLKVRGPYIVTEEENANGRKYSKKMMEEKWVPEFIKDVVETGGGMGELNHPPNTDINPERICHKIINLKQDGNNWIGESVILSSSPDGKIKGTPNGDILASIVQHSCRIGMSTRGVGEINEDGMIDSEYKLITVDAVTNPSGPGCFVEGILESKNFMINTHGEIVEMAYNDLENGLKTLPKNEKQVYVETILRKFLDKIR